MRDEELNCKYEACGEGVGRYCCYRRIGCGWWVRADVWMRLRWVLMRERIKDRIWRVLWLEIEVHAGQMSLLLRYGLRVRDHV